ncbi:MAG: LysR family transcriptional regulator substrate-binding protein [bacterium]
MIGCFDSLGAYFLPGFLPGFTEAHPRVDITLATGPSRGRPGQRVIDQDVDFGIVVNPQPHPDLVMVPLFDDAVDFFAVEPAPSRVAAVDRIQRGTVLLAARVQQSHTLLEQLADEEVHPHRLLRCGSSSW